jgi:hypothetical protein
MNEPQQISLSNFLASIRERGIHEFSRIDGGRFAFSRGFHVYGDLRINLTLSAAEDDSSARRFLQIIDTYSAIAEECARSVGTEILELQGERIHALTPGETLSEEVFQRLFAFSIALTNAVYEEIAPAAGEHWGGFSMAADFGPAVLIASDCGGGSVVSLGNAANTPAKRLGRTPVVEAGHLALRRHVHEAIEHTLGNAEWIEVNVLQPPEKISRFSNYALNEKLVTLAAAELGRPTSYRNIIVAKAAYVDDPSRFSVAEPFRVQGHCLRADLDGFTNQVEAAFKSGPEAVKRLVKRFHDIMGYARDYARSLNRPVIEMPWAGDCATIILMPRDTETYHDTSRYLPVTAAVKWHDQEAAETTDRIAWRKLLESAMWALGVAGGNDEEGSNGVMLIANVRSSRRAFRVAVGWAPRRSNDGYQASGVRAGDTVIHNVDYQNIDDDYKEAFRELDSRFRVAPLMKLRELITQKTATLGNSTPLQMPAIVRPIPAPRPHWNEFRARTK